MNCSGCKSVAIIDGSAHCAAPSCPRHIEHMDEAKQQLSEAQAQIAMKDEALRYIHPYFIPGKDCSDRMSQAAEELIEQALSATSEIVAAWRAKETEPLRREGAMLRDALKVAYEYCPDDHDFDYIADVLSSASETALAYEREVENRGAVKALERIIRGGCDLDFIEAVLEEIRAANKGEVK